MANENKWHITIEAPFRGFAPAWWANTYPSFGNRNQFGDMQNADMIDPTGMTQGPALSNLTNGTQAGVVTTLIKHILDVPVSSNRTFAIGGALLYELNETTVSSGGTPSWPRTIDKAAVTGEDGESVCYYGGNLYYFYNHSGSAGDIGKYDLASTFDDDWGCYSEDTEVLTTEGWKRIKDVCAGADIYSMNPETKIVEITKNKETIVKPFCGNAIRFKSEGIDVLVTPDHKMFASAGLFQKKAKSPNPYQIVRADSLIGKQFRLKKNAEWKGKMIEQWEIPAYDNGSINVIERDEKGRIKSCSGKRYYRPSRSFPIRPFLRLIGFYLSEGSTNEKCISISQRTYSKGWQPIKDTLDELGVNYGYYGQSFDIHDKQLTQYIRSIIPCGFYNIRIPREMMKLHPSLLMELFDSMMLGDGDGMYHYYTSSPALRDDFIELVNRLGWSAKFSISSKAGDIAFHGKATVDGFDVLINKEKNEQAFNHHNGENNTSTVTTEKYNGNIVCLALEKNHIMLVRRNGKTVWCGNSTVPTGAAALQSAPHPSVVGNDDVMYFGNGRYVGYYDKDTGTGGTLSEDDFDVPQGSQVVDVRYHNSRVWVAVNYPNLTGSNNNWGIIYLWAGAGVSSWDDFPNPRIQGRIGAIYPKDGTMFVWYQDLTSTGGYKLGYVRGNEIVEITSFVGSLPLYYQVLEYKNMLAWISNGLVYVWGATDKDVPVALTQLADGGYATVGAFASPFGTPMAASTDGGGNFRLAQFSGFETSANAKTLMFDVSPSMVDRVVVHYDPTATGARVDLTLRYNRGGSSTLLGDIRHANDSGQVRKNFYPAQEVDDFRLEFDWANGSATNALKVRKIEVFGHFLIKE